MADLPQTISAVDCSDYALLALLEPDGGDASNSPRDYPAMNHSDNAQQPATESVRGDAPVLRCETMPHPSRSDDAQHAVNEDNPTTLRSECLLPKYDCRTS